MATKNNQNNRSKKSVRYALNKNKYLLEDEYQRLTGILKSFESKDSRNTTLIWTALLTGARAQEILNLTKDDLNPQEQSIFIRGLKGSNDRELPLASWHYLKLSKLAHAEAGGNIFPISYNRLYQIWDLYRPTHKSFHSLRHTFAVRLYKRTKDIRLVQVALGHRNIANTMIYAEYVYSQEELRKLILT